LFFGLGLPVLMAGHLIFNSMHWNSLLNKIIFNAYFIMHEISCLIFGPDTNNPNTTFATPDVFEIVITKKLSAPGYLIPCSTISSEYLTVLIDTACLSYFQHPTDRSDFMRTDWANFQTHFEGQIPFYRDLHNGTAIDTCVDNFIDAVL
jgi:hypothetical protein